MTGTRKVLPPGSVVPRPGRIEVRIGKPLTFAPEILAAPPGKARRLIANQVMSAIKNLSGQEYVHMYASDRKAQLAASNGHQHDAAPQVTPDRDDPLRDNTPAPS